MNKITNNNLSFKANLSSDLKELRPIAKQFQEISKGKRGTLSIYSKDGELFATDGTSKVFVGNELSKYFSLAHPTKQDKTTLAQKALNTLKLLQAETLYESQRNNYSQFQRKIDELYAESLAPDIYNDLRGAI